MNTGLIMLGSNENAANNLELAIEKLSEHFDIEKTSTSLITKPVGNKYKSNFHNIALKILSAETAEETKSIFKQIELEMGRTTDSKQKGEIPIDIDLIFWNNIQVHNDYDRFDFVQKCIDEVI